MFACVHSRHGNLLALANAFSPVIEMTDSDTVIFSIAGLESLIGTPHQIASEISCQGATLGIIQAGLAIAHNADTALLIARNTQGATIVPSGEEATCLSDISVDALDTTPQILETFARWGIRTLGDLAALPEIGLVE